MLHLYFHYISSPFLLPEQLEQWRCRLCLQELLERKRQAACLRMRLGAPHGTHRWTRWIATTPLSPIYCKFHLLFQGSRIRYG